MQRRGKDRVERYQGVDRFHFGASGTYAAWLDRVARRGELALAASLDEAAPG